MGGLHPAIDATCLLADEHSFTAKDVAAIRIQVPAAVHHHGWWQPERPLTTIGAQMNIAYAVAVALLDGTVGPAQFTDERIDADDVWALIARTTVEQVDRRQDPAWNQPGYNTRVTFRLHDGRDVTHALNQPHGGPDSPLTDDAIVAKFRGLSAHVIDPDRAQQIERRVLALESERDLGPLIDLLAAPVRGALD